MPAKSEYWRDPEKHRASTRAYKATHPEWARKSNREWVAKDRATNPEKHASIRHFYRARNPARYLLNHARNRAKKLGVPFALTEQDIVIPEFCPVLGLRFEWGVGKRASQNRTSPSLDRIVPELGYVRGNVRIISNRANHIKNNGTGSELTAIARYVRIEEGHLAAVRLLDLAGRLEPTGW
jgi:hypothetical protein